MTSATHSPPITSAPNDPPEQNCESQNKPVSRVFDLSRAELELMMRGLLHEMRNPLSSIITAATLLQESSTPNVGAIDIGEETDMLLGVVKKESLRLNHILTEFANFIKILAPQPKAFDIVASIRAAVAELQRDGVLAENVEIEDNLPDTCLVWADESQIGNALRHLLHNAGEAMRSGGCLALLQPASDSTDRVAFCFGDSGGGFTGESRERAFQPFYSTKAHSLGLGLPAAKTLIEAAEGRLWIEHDAHSSTLWVGGNSSNAAAAENTKGPPLVFLCFELPLAT